MDVPENLKGIVLVFCAFPAKPSTLTILLIEILHRRLKRLNIRVRLGDSVKERVA
jgi:hypothetical protein